MTDNQPQVRRPKHRCNAMGCESIVNGRSFMRAKHWKQIDRTDRDIIKRDLYYQACGVKPSGEFISTSREAIDTIAAREGRIAFGAG